MLASPSAAVTAALTFYFKKYLRSVRESSFASDCYDWCKAEKRTCITSTLLEHMKKGLSNHKWPVDLEEAADGHHRKQWDAWNRYRGEEALFTVIDDCFGFRTGRDHRFYPTNTCVWEPMLCATYELFDDVHGLLFPEEDDEDDNDVDGDGNDGDDDDDAVDDDDNDGDDKGKEDEKKGGQPNDSVRAVAQEDGKMKTGASDDGDRRSSCGSSEVMTSLSATQCEWQTQSF
jgi:hypothetical protein